MILAVSTGSAASVMSSAVQAEANSPFRSLKGALLFAYNFTHGPLPQTAMAKMAGKPAPVGRGLSGLDGAGQAGMIKAAVGDLTPVRAHIITGRYANKTLPCPCKRPCCAGSILNGEWAAAVEFLTEHIFRAALTGTVSHFRLRRVLIVRFLGEEASIAKVAEMCGVHRDTAADHNKRVVEYLRHEEDVAEIELRGKLEASGLIGG